MKQTTNKQLSWALFMLAFLAAGCDPAAQSTPPTSLAPIVIEQAYVRAPVASSTTATAYFTLYNNSDKTLTLLSVTSTLAKSMEIHEHQHDNGTMRMRRLPSLNIDANSSVKFQPGGKHLMLFGFNAANAEQDQLTFSFDNGQQIKQAAPIKSLL